LDTVHPSPKRLQIQVDALSLPIVPGTEQKMLIDRVCAHVFVVALAFLLDRALEKKLRAANSALSSPAVWQALETVRCVEVAVGDRRKLCVTRGSRQASELLKAVGLTELDPPLPPEATAIVLW
jgi:hypothetical protein